MKETITKALFEATFVVLGVVLALAANEWRQHLADKRHSDLARQSIIEEIKNNRAAVAVSLDYHAQLLEVLYTEYPDDWVPDLQQFNRGFISPARTSRTAWDSASETGALAKTDFTIVVEYSKIYALQERYENQAQSIGGIIYAEIFRHGSDSIVRNYRNLANTISTFVYRERELLEHFDIVIAANADHN